MQDIQLGIHSLLGASFVWAHLEILLFVVLLFCSFYHLIATVETVSSDVVSTVQLTRCRVS
jgi:hypothetical protein